ncbi:hypothetical protein BCU68_14685 [Vibrio sp. 10N.286.49.B3]|uniref:response regulator n=1 Tax=Vibrio sp. 10N.286.49.B3 TaxID=1880855 RepID=UPI000C83FCC5|nr:response regulator [Vibrio sp. 10N.286.49.B3]PMH42148.1 hypothetical protein BCU68_14685 [Vibrio sp. 10N.286.49.B3]
MFKPLENILKSLHNLKAFHQIEQKASQIPKIILGFAIVLSLLVAVGLRTWQGVNKMIDTFDRYAQRGELLTALDRARLHELTYAKDMQPLTAKKVEESVDLAIELANDLSHSQQQSILQRLENYRYHFLNYRRLAESHQIISQDVLIKSAQAIESVNELLHAQSDQISQYRISMLELQDRSVDSVKPRQQLVDDKAQLLTLLQSLEDSLEAARQWSRDFLLSGDRYKKRDYQTKALDSLDIALKLSEEVGRHLLKSDDHLAFKVADLNVHTYVDAFKNLKELDEKLELTAHHMVSSAKQADKLLLDVKQEIVNDFNQVRSESVFISFLLAVFFISLTVLGYLIYQSMSNLIKYIMLSRESRDKALEASKVKSKFLANMSHEIRTPMNAIIGMSQLALNSDLDPKQKKYITNIHSASNSLLNITNDILDLSKLESGTFTIESIDFSLRDLLDNVSNLMSFSAQQKGLKFNAVIPLELPDHIQGDPTRINQVLMNLIGNAVKFTQEGSVTLSVTHHCEKDGTLILYFSVTDTGIGIKAQDLTRLFQPFSQLDGSTSRIYGGTGLGLVISKQLIEMMGGTINVMSTPQMGSRFEFDITSRLVVRQPAAKPMAEVEAKSLNQRLDILKDKRILLAEDNDINQQLVEALIGDKLHLTLCSNGQEALTLIAQYYNTEQAFDGVLMDCQMPVMDGYTATQAIRQELGLTLPILAMTANVMKEDHQQALDSGMNDVIGKPIDTSEMFNKMLRWFADESEGAMDDQAAVLDQADETTDLSPYLQRLSGACCGVDVPGGLTLVGNDQNLCERLVRQFAEEYREFEVENKASFVHRLKGTAGNLSFMTLYQACLQYESAPSDEEFTLLINEINYMVATIDKVSAANDADASESFDDVINGSFMELEKDMDSELSNLVGHVLIVEDDLINQMLLKNMLQDFGVTTDVASDGLIALEKIAASKAGYDLVMTDFFMPNLNGSEFAEHLRTNIARYGYLNIIGMTGESSLPEKETQHMDIILHKPFNRAEIHAALSKYLLVSSQNYISRSLNEKFSSYSVESRLEVFNIIVTTLSADIVTVRKAQGDSLAAISHKIKGSSNMLGLTDMANLARDLQNEQDQGVIDDIKSQLEKEMLKVIDETSTMIDELGFEG